MHLLEQSRFWGYPAEVLTDKIYQQGGKRAVGHRSGTFNSNIKGVLHGTDTEANSKTNMTESIINDIVESGPTVR